MKYYLMAIFLLLCMATSIIAADNRKNDDSYYDFLNGSFEVIGRYPDSNKTYTGKVVFKKTHETLEVIRTINNKTIKGIGNIDNATADKIKVFRVTFVENKKEYEATYLIDSDLDNYCRLTGYIYLKAGGTKYPGLEALFSDHIYKK